MHGSRSLERRFIVRAVLFILLLLPNSTAYPREKPVGFAIPSRILPLGEAVTPREYAELRQAIEAWERKEAKVLEMGAGLGDLNRIGATRIQLGALGEGMVVSFQGCGATGNCPMAVFVLGAKGFRNVISSGGWKYALLPSGGQVPDVAFYWNMSCCESDVQLFHYVRGQFVARSASACTDKNSSSTVCAAMHATGMWFPSITPAGYDALRPRVEADIEKESPGLAHQILFEEAHAVDIFGHNQSVATAVGLSSCGARSNCRISIYVHDVQGGNTWPLLRNVSGWGVTVSAVEASAGLRMSFVIARRLSASQTELTRYSVPLRGHTGELSPGDRPLPDACEIVTPKTGEWPAHWDAAALTAQPVACFPQSPTVGAGEAGTLEADTTNVSAVVQDGDGVIWAIGGGISGGLYRWHDGGWSAVPGPSQRSMAAGLWPGADGGVIVLWLKSPMQENALIWLRGDETKNLGTLPIIGQPPRGHLDVQDAVSSSSGTLLITGDGGVGYRNGVVVSGPAPGIFRLDEKGQLNRIFTFAPDQYQPYRAPAMGPPYFLPLETTRDGQGKIWIWCGWSSPGGTPGAALAGFLVTDGKTVEYHREIPGLSNHHLTSLDLWDMNHLAAAAFDDGLYTINIATLEAQRVPEPQPGAFRFVQKVFHDGNDSYVLTLGPSLNGPVSPEMLPFLTGTLWRWHDGQWKEVLHDIGDSTGAGVASREGFWLGSLNGGLWYAPTDGPATKIDWRQGLPLATVNCLFRLTNGNILATFVGHYTETRSVELHPASVMAQPKASTTFTVLDLTRPPEADRGKHVWGIMPQGILGEWDGASWVQHPFPSIVQPARIIGLDVDTSGRVWLFPNCRMGPMAFFDPRQNQWSSYQDYRFALAGRAHPVEFLHPEDDRERAIYGPDAQIVFRGPCGGINYFDCKRWRLWNNDHLPPNIDIAIPPFFDQAGHLYIGAYRATWQWDSATGWKQAPYEPQENIVPLLPDTLRAPTSPPPGCASSPPSSLVRDAIGRSWWVGGDALYEGVSGQCHVVLPGSAPQPFIDGRQLDRVVLDGRGNVFLCTRAPSSCIFLRSSMDAGKSQPGAAEHLVGPQPNSSASIGTAGARSLPSATPRKPGWRI